MKSIINHIQNSVVEAIIFFVVGLLMVVLMSVLYLAFGNNPFFQQISAGFWVTYSILLLGSIIIGTFAFLFLTNKHTQIV